MATTSKGIWYPDGSTPYSLRAILQQLATSVNTNAAKAVSGTATVTLTASAVGTQTVSYASLGAPSGTVPAISVNSGNSLFNASISGSPSSSGMTIAVRTLSGSTTTASVTVYWSAVLP